MLRYIVYPRFNISFLYKVARMILLQLNICPCPNSLTWCVGPCWHDPCFSLQPWILYISLPPHMASFRHTELFLSEKGPSPLCPLDLHMWVCLQYFALLWLLQLDRTHLWLSVNIHFCTKSCLSPMPLCFHMNSFDRALGTLKHNVPFTRLYFPPDSECLEGSHI